MIAALIRHWHHDFEPKEQQLLQWPEKIDFDGESNDSSFRSYKPCLPTLVVWHCSLNLEVWQTDAGRPAGRPIQRYFDGTAAPGCSQVASFIEMGKRTPLQRSIWIFALTTRKLLVHNQSWKTRFVELTRGIIAFLHQNISFQVIVAVEVRNFEALF